MSNPYYEDNWKLFLKCKQCWNYKEICKDNWYYHNEWFLWVLWRCRECIKKWRATQHELEMARVRDAQRYKNNQKRRQQIYDSAKRRNKRHIIENKNWYRDHARAWHKIKKMWIRPQQCPICWHIWRIVAHHPDINIRNEIVFCCQICHDAIHKWKIKWYTKIDLFKF